MFSMSVSILDTQLHVTDRTSSIGQGNCLHYFLSRFDSATNDAILWASMLPCTVDGLSKIAVNKK